MLSCCHKENADEVIHCTRTDRPEVNTELAPREPLRGARLQITSQRYPRKTCAAVALEPEVAFWENCVEPDLWQECVSWKQFRFYMHHVQKDLYNAVRMQKRRLLGEARLESDELENEWDGKRLLEQYCDWDVDDAENLPRRPEFCITCDLWLKEPAMLMQDLLHQWWMGYLKNYCHAQARPHQASRQLVHLVGLQLSTWTVLHQLRTCENGCVSCEHQCGAQKHKCGAVY